MKISIHWVLRHGSRLALACASWCLLFAAPARAAELQVLHGHLPAIVARLAPVGSLAATQRLNLAIGLPLRNQEALTNLLHDLYDPASPQVHHYLTTVQFTELFGPTEEHCQAVIAFARRHGLTVTGVEPNHMLVNVSGTAADVGKALHVSMRLYRHPTENRTFYAPDVEPSLDLAVPVLHIGGLDSYVRPYPRSHLLKPLDAKASSTFKAGRARTAPTWEGFHLGVRPRHDPHRRGAKSWAVSGGRLLPQ